MSLLRLETIQCLFSDVAYGYGFIRKTFISECERDGVEMETT